MKRVCIFTGTRADYSRLKSVIGEINDHSELDGKVIVAGTHLIKKFGDTLNEIINDGISIERSVFTLLEGENLVTMAKSVGITVSEMATVYQNLKPDIVLVHGDRFETFGAAVAASIMNIVVAHIQGGEVTGSIDESLRHAITKLAHIHFVSNEDAKTRVIKLGEDPKLVFNVGCPMTDILLTMKLIDKKDAFEKIKETFHNGSSYEPSKPYSIAIMHPVTTQYGHNIEPVRNMLRAIDSVGLQTILLWPNADAGAREVVESIKKFIREKTNSVHIDVFDNLPIRLFLSLLKNAALIIGNSSSAIREACYFGTPAVNIGSRQRGRTRGTNVIDANEDYENILQAVKRQLAHGRYGIEMPYGRGSAGKQIASILASIGMNSTQKIISY